MPATTSRQSTTMTHRRDRVRVSRSTGSRVKESIACLGTVPAPHKGDIGTGGELANASLDVASHRQRDAPRQDPRLQTGELVLKRPGGHDPTAPQRLVEAQQGLEAREPDLRQSVLVGEQGGLRLQ